MFSEYKELMTRLKATDPHFAELCAKHDALDQQIHDIEAHTEVSTYEHLEDLKKEKLLVRTRFTPNCARSARTKAAPRAH